MLTNIAHRYPENLMGDQLRDVPLIHFNISLILRALAKPPSEIEICDIGGGSGYFRAFVPPTE